MLSQEENKSTPVLDHPNITLEMFEVMVSFKTKCIEFHTTDSLRLSQ